jgi:hypothetical protein
MQIAPSFGFGACDRRVSACIRFSPSHRQNDTEGTDVALADSGSITGLPIPIHTRKRGYIRLSRRRISGEGASTMLARNATFGNVGRKLNNSNSESNSLSDSLRRHALQYTSRYTTGERALRFGPTPRAVLKITWNLEATESMPEF